MKILFLLVAVPFFCIAFSQFPVAAGEPLVARRELPAQTELELGNNL